MPDNEGKILLYQSDGGKVTVDERFEDETFWVTQKAMGELFDVESHTITYHLQEIYKTEELEESATTRKIRVVRKEGNRNVGRDYFDELLERIREIRASERRAYQKIADVFEQCSYDYNKSSQTTRDFYAVRR